MSQVIIKNTNLGQICSQKLEDLNVINQQYFCSSCQQNVIDFTVFSDLELIKYIKETPKHCGYYNIEQIAKPINFSFKPFKPFVLLSFFSLFTSLKSFTNNQKAHKTEQQPTNKDFFGIKNIELSIDTPKIEVNENKTTIKPYKRKKKFYISSRFPFVFRRNRRLMGCFNF